MEAHRRRVHKDCPKAKPPANLGHSCPHCPAVLASSYHYQRHLEAHRKNEGVFSCSHCGKNFKDRRKLSVHMKHHQIQKKYQCDLCGLSFLQLEFLKRHQRVHTDERPYKCSVCSASFRQQVHLQRHCQRLHGESTKPTLDCPQCSKSFLTRSELKNHLLYHQPPSHACPSCPQVFTEKRHLDRHFKRIHGNLRPHNCPQCNKAFCEKYELNYHLKFSCQNKKDLQV